MTDDSRQLDNAHERNDLAALQALADEAHQPLPDAAAFTRRVLDRWEAEEPAGAIDHAEPAPPLMMSSSRSRRGSLPAGLGIAAAVAIAATLGFLAGRQTAPQPGESAAVVADKSPADADRDVPSAAPLADPLTAHVQSDPVGVLLVDVSREIDQRPQQVRRALQDATAMLTSAAGFSRPGLAPLEDAGSDASQTTQTN